MNQSLLVRNLAMCLLAILMTALLAEPGIAADPPDWDPDGDGYVGDKDKHPLVSQRAEVYWKISRPELRFAADFRQRVTKYVDSSTSAEKGVVKEVKESRETLETKQKDSQWNAGLKTSLKVKASLVPSPHIGASSETEATTSMSTGGSNISKETQVRSDLETETARARVNHLQRARKLDETLLHDAYVQVHVTFFNSSLSDITCEEMKGVLTRDGVPVGLSLRFHKSDKINSEPTEEFTLRRRGGIGLKYTFRARIEDATLLDASLDWSKLRMEIESGNGRITRENDPGGIDYLDLANNITKDTFTVTVSGHREEIWRVARFKDSQKTTRLTIKETLEAITEADEPGRSEGSLYELSGNRLRSFRGLENDLGNHWHIYMGEQGRMNDKDWLASDLTGDLHLRYGPRRPDYLYGRELFQRVAKQAGDPYCIFMDGVLRIHKSGSPEEGLKLVEDAAEKGYDPAKYWLAVKAPGLTLDERLQLLEVAARNEYGPAVVELARTVIERNPDPARAKEAVELLRDSPFEYDPEALYLRALAFYNGFAGLACSHEEAEELWGIAGSSTHVPSLYMLACARRKTNAVAADALLQKLTEMPGPWEDILSPEGLLFLARARLRSRPAGDVPDTQARDTQKADEKTLNILKKAFPGTAGLSLAESLIRKNAFREAEFVLGHPDPKDPPPLSVTVTIDGKQKVLPTNNPQARAAAIQTMRRENVVAAIKRAKTLYASGLRQSAMDLFDSMLSADHVTAMAASEIWYQKGLCYLGDSKLVDANAAFEKCLLIEKPSDPVVRKRLGIPRANGFLGQLKVLLSKEEEAWRKGDEEGARKLAIRAQDHALEVIQTKDKTPEAKATFCEDPEVGSRVKIWLQPDPFISAQLRSALESAGKPAAGSALAEIDRVFPGARKRAGCEISYVEGMHHLAKGTPDDLDLANKCFAECLKSESSEDVRRELKLPAAFGWLGRLKVCLAREKATSDEKEAAKIAKEAEDFIMWVVKEKDGEAISTFRDDKDVASWTASGRSEVFEAWWKSQTSLNTQTPDEM